MMQAVTLEVESDKFANLGDRVEVFDASGHLLGQFMPSHVRVVDIPFTPEEIQRRIEEANTGPLYTTAEVLAHLKTLETA